MLFFKRILQDPKPASPAREERRSSRRFIVSPEFPLKAVVSFIGRDEHGAPLSSTRSGWNWKGRLIDCSEQGAQVLLGPGVRTTVGEHCDLRLGVATYELGLPSEVMNIREQADGVVFGLKLDLANADTLADFRQLLEVIALGSTLKLQPRPAKAKPDASGYLLETYASNRPSRLSVWRNAADDSIAAFEFQLKDNLVRAAAGHRVEYLSDLDGTGSRPASSTKCLEIQRLFTWVVPNLAPAVADDVRAFLRHYAV